MRTFRWNILLLVLLALAISVQITGCKGKEIVGISAIDFTLEGINGGQVAYSDIKGKPVLLYFFASW